MYSILVVYKNLIKSRDVGRDLLVRGDHCVGKCETVEYTFSEIVSCSTGTSAMNENPEGEFYIVSRCDVCNLKLQSFKSKLI